MNIRKTDGRTKYSVDVAFRKTRFKRVDTRKIGISTSRGDGSKVPKSEDVRKGSKQMDEMREEVGLEMLGINIYEAEYFRIRFATLRTSWPGSEKQTGSSTHSKFKQQV